MASDSQRSPWFVGVLVALIGALGLVGAAVLPKLIDSGGQPSSSSTPPSEPSEPSEPDAPDIAGDYSLDPGSSRIIIIRRAGDDSFDVWEKEPANWPFTGRVRWDGDVFTGRADFTTSQDSMIITLEEIGQGRLHATFAFTNPADRVDEHTLVPV